MSLILVFIVAFLIRLIFLNQSLWLDEAIVARVVSQYKFFEILTKFSIFDFHPPLYYWLMKLWTNIFGLSEISLRMPSIIFSLLTGYFIYKIGIHLKDEKLGFWSAILFLFNPLIIYYSQEARMYMMATFLTAGSFYYFLLIQKKSRHDNLLILILFNLFLILSFYTFYGSVFLILTYLVYFLLKKKKYYFQLTTILFLIFLILISPLLFYQVTNAHQSLKEVVNWSLVLGKANIKNLLLIPIKFLIGRISFYPKYLYWLSVLFVLIFFIDVIKNYFDNYLKNNINEKKIKLVLYFLLTPIFFGFLISFFVPMLNYFRFLYVIPFLSIYLSFITVFTKEKFHHYIFFIFLFFSMIYFIFPYFHREDWKSLSLYLRKNNINEVYIISSSSDPINYYNNKIKINSLKSVCDERVFLDDKKIYVIPYSSEIWGVDYKKCLNRQGKNYLLTINFRGLTLEYYR
ncbi:MAG: hypothetical protein Fur009_7310 [Candidatus Microgenomates bacterium]